MRVAVYAGIYLGLVIFLIGCIGRVMRYARTPIHLRWELYPVPHEEPARVAHGGSYFESSDWWKQPRHTNRVGELRVMAPEMVFLKSLWECNRKLWYASFLFHFGLYCTIASVALVGGQAMMSAAVPGWTNGLAGLAIAVLYRVTGCAALLLTLAGAAALLWRRLYGAELKNFTSPADIFNLVFFILTYCVLGAAFYTRPASVAEIARGVLTFDVNVHMAPLMGIGLVMASVLIAYIPFTHMAHFIAKYFTYHAVRWDDRANARGGKIETAVAGYLAYKPNWAATRFAIMSGHNFPDWRFRVSGRKKLQQLLQAFSDCLQPETPKYLCAPCSNCKGQFRDMLSYYKLWEQNRILYGGLVELIVNAMADVKPGFIEWEWR